MPGWVVVTLPGGESGTQNTQGYQAQPSPYFLLPTSTVAWQGAHLALITQQASLFQAHVSLDKAANLKVIELDDFKNF